MIRQTDPTILQIPASHAWVKLLVSVTLKHLQSTLTCTGHLVLASFAQQEGRPEKYSICLSIGIKVQLDSERKTINSPSQTMGRSAAARCIIYEY